jgi:hypothetical protein
MTVRVRRAMIAICLLLAACVPGPDKAAELTRVSMQEHFSSDTAKKTPATASAVSVRHGRRLATSADAESRWQVSDRLMSLSLLKSMGTFRIHGCIPLSYDHAISLDGAPRQEKTVDRQQFRVLACLA